jgi:hypothetical protein
MQENSLHNDFEKVLLQYPKLTYTPDINSGEFSGVVDLYDGSGIYVDSFDIKLSVPPKYPFAFPTLYEMGGRFAHIPDRHFNEDDSCCVCSLQELDLESARGITIERYLQKYCMAFLANQIYFDATGRWLNGEYAHGSEGILQFYTELLPGFTAASIIALLSAMRDELTTGCDDTFSAKASGFENCPDGVIQTIGRLSKERITEDILHIQLLILQSALTTRDVIDESGGS